MVTQPLTHGAELPLKLGTLLAEAPARFPDQDSAAVQEFIEILKNTAEESSQIVSQFERDLSRSEQLVNFALTGFVEFIRQAGQDDETAREFNDWADGLDLATAFDTYANNVAPRLKEHTAILRKIVKGWQRRAKAGEIEPEPPREIAGRVAQLDAHVKKLTRQITKREDNELVARLLIRVARHRPLSGAEKIRLSDAVRMKVVYKVEPSIRRADWYGEDGR